jgi:flagellar P-ring protein precursor FlgI
VDVYVPEEMQRPERQMEFVARVENASFVPDVNARIVINERTGTLVANANIQISKIAVAFGNLTVAISSSPTVSQPNVYLNPDGSTYPGTVNGTTGGNLGNGNGGPGGGGPGSPGFAGGGGGGRGPNQGIHTQVINQTTTNVQEDKRSIVVMKDMPTVEDVAFALNSMGATPRELMSILQSIKDAGALNAELVLE